MAQTYSQPLVAAAGVNGAVAPDVGALGFAAVTGTTAGTANTVTTTTKERRALWYDNAMDADVVLTVGGITTNLIIKASRNGVLDLQSALVGIGAAQVIGVYRRSGAPTSGEILLQLI